MTRYLLLTSDSEKDVIVKQEGSCFYGFQNGMWKRRGISAGFFLPGAPEFERYQVIEEKDVERLLKNRA